MKLGRRVLALTLLLLLVLSGCGKKEAPAPEPTPEPVTAATLLRDMNERLREQGSATAEVQAALSFTADNGGETMAFPLDMALTLDMIFEPLQYHAAGSAGMAYMGMDMELPLEVYARQQDGSLCTYVNVLDRWMRQSVETGEGSGLPALTGVDLSEEILAAAVLSEEPERVLDRDARRIDLTVTGSMLQKALSAVDSEASAEMDRIDWDGVSVSCVFWIDPETGLPVRQSIKTTAPIRGGEVSIDKLELLIDYTGFGCVSGITIPEEALNAPDGTMPNNIM